MGGSLSEDRLQRTRDVPAAHELPTCNYALYLHICKEEDTPHTEVDCAYSIVHDGAGRAYLQAAGAGSHREMLRCDILFGGLTGVATGRATGCRLKGCGGSGAIAYADRCHRQGGALDHEP
jgi:hypothetical protein